MDDDAASAPSSHRAGYTLLFLSVLIIGAGLHFYKAALRDSSPATILALVSSAGIIIFLVAGGVARLIGRGSEGLRAVRATRILAFIGSHKRWSVFQLVAAAGAALLMATVVKQYNAETAAFLGNQTLVFLVIGGVLSGERITWPQAVNICIVITGAFLFSYRENAIQWGALGMMTAACVAIAMKQLFIKHLSQSGDLPTIMAAALLLISVFAGATALVTRTWITPDMRTLGFATLSAVATNVLGMMMLYAGYHRVGVSLGAPINALRPLSVLLLGLAIGNPLPGRIPLVGAAAILFGSVGLTLRKPGIATRQQIN